MAIAAEWVGGLLSPEILGPWDGMYVILIGPWYVSVGAEVWVEQRRWL